MAKDTELGMWFLLYSLRNYRLLHCFDPVEEYGNNTGKLYSPISINVSLGKAINTLCNAVEQRATDEEIDRLMRYICVATDTFKYNLDLDRAAKDSNINELYKKYREPKKSKK